ncbi:MAG: hypoxanthine-guanine phosphoribosyltransferase [Pseudomonadota bacterium]
MHEQMMQVFEKSEVLLSETQVLEGISRLGKEITKDLQGSDLIVICVMNGGLVFCGQLMTKLKFPLRQDYVHVGRYGDTTSGGRLRWKQEPNLKLENKTVLIVDDILDEGATLKSIIEYCQQAEAKEVKTAVLLDKQHARKVSPNFKADYCAFEIEDKFVFGFGLDYKGYWRNAPGIYALT